MYSINQYNTNGFVSPIQVMTESRAGNLADRVQELRKTKPELAERAFGTNCHLLFPWLHELAHIPELLDEVERVIGSDIMLWSAGFFIKDPCNKTYVSWHQDSTYWGLEPPEIVTAWIALTPSTTANGCMQVIPGSHRRGQLTHIDKFDDDNMLSRGQEIEVDIRGEQIVNLVLKPGEMSLHHVRIFHGSRINGSNDARIGFAMRFIPASVSQKGGRTFAELVRGEDRFKNFDAPNPPSVELGKEEWSMHQESLRRLNKIVLHDSALPSKIIGHQTYD